LGLPSDNTVGITKSGKTMSLLEDYRWIILTQSGRKSMTI